MTIQLSCNQVVIDSQLPSSGSQLMKLTVTGKDVNRSVVLTGSNMPVTVTANTIFSTPKFPAKPLLFTLLVQDADNAYLEETRCGFIDCEGLGCSVADSLEKDRIIYYAALTSSQCYPCNCDKLNVIYNKLNPTSDECSCTSCS